MKKKTSPTKTEEAPAVEFVRAPALEWLWNHRIQRVDSPKAGLFALTLYERGEKQSLLLMLEPSQLGVAASNRRPIGQAATAFVRRLRKYVENGRLSKAQWILASGSNERAAGLQLDVARGETSVSLVADFDARGPNLYILDDQFRPAGASDEAIRRKRFPGRAATYQPASGPGVPLVTSALALRALGDASEEARDVLLDRSVRNSVRGLAQSALRKVRRRVHAIEGDLERIHRAPLMRDEANQILCHLQFIERGSPSFEVLGEDGQPRVIALDPSLAPQQDAQRRFERARRLSRGEPIAQARLDEARAQAAQLEGLLADLDSLPIEALAERASQARIQVPFASSTSAPPATPRKASKPQHVAYRTFIGSGGARVFVGKNAADNDTLTLTIARPHDLWLHARGVAGSHVVVPLQRGTTASSELLVDAALLAAHFSVSRGETPIEIQYTERRYIRKPRGNGPGAVQVDREKVMLLRVVPDRLKTLLDSEVVSP